MHELNNLRASDLAVNSNKDTWIAVERRGLHNITTGQEIVVDGPMDNYIGEMLIDSRGYLWCTTGLPKDERKQGVYVRTDEGWINYLFSGGNGNRYRNFNSTLAVFEDAEQNIWIGSWGGGLLVFDQEFNMHPINPMSDSGSVWINSINNDDTVRVQTSSELQGIISSVDNDPFYSVITDFILDFKTQSIWLSNLAAKNRRSLIQYKGVAFTDAALLESAWESYSNPSGNDQWFEMTQDPFGDIWLASGGAGVIQARLEDNILKTAK
ncbi:MAG: hypothetical protein GWN00_35490, partial [Aliifodinibius sp.]|nr:hypothetical protein [Fodinibius sp.]NIV15953.1 hypothetical protein [Fodinibius sp.]NIY29902.1 hypothetical protein [Fodinibius sp.]